MALLNTTDLNRLPAARYVNRHSDASLFRPAIECTTLRGVIFATMQMAYQYANQLELEIKELQCARQLWMVAGRNEVSSALAQYPHVGRAPLTSPAQEKAKLLLL